MMMSEKYAWVGRAGREQAILQVKAGATLASYLSRQPTRQEVNVC